MPKHVQISGFLTLAEAADVLGVSKETLRQWAKAGKIQSRTIPRGVKQVNWRFTAAAVERLRRRLERGLPA